MRADKRPVGFFGRVICREQALQAQFLRRDRAKRADGRHHGKIVEPNAIFLRDAPLVTSAGVTAGIDLALALVAEDHGAAVALSCAKRLVVAVQRQGGQSQFSPFLLPPAPPGSPLAKVQQQVMEHPAQAYPVERLAEIAGVSPRSVARLFTSELGVTPRDFVESVRVDHARNLLEATALALKAVAYDCGFKNTEQMRLVFLRRLGLSPAQYREKFRARPPTPAPT